MPFNGISGMEVTLQSSVDRYVARVVQGFTCTDNVKISASGAMGV